MGCLLTRIGGGFAAPFHITTYNKGTQVSATKITPLRLTEDEREFLAKVGGGSIIDGVRKCIEVTKSGRKENDEEAVKNLATEVLEMIKKMK